MKDIFKKEWDYTLYENGEKLILSVVCGSVAIYLVNLELNKSEVNSYKKNGLVFIAQFADKIREKPSMFKERHKELSSFVQSI